MKKINLIIEKLLSLLRNRPQQIPSKKKVVETVKYSVGKYPRTMRMLEMYDRGELATPEILVRYRNMRDYLRDVQKASENSKDTLSSA